jgi:hypothetical protein
MPQPTSTSTASSSRTRRTTSSPFIGAGAFTGVKGQLHYVVAGPNVDGSEGDINGDAVADFAINVHGRGCTLAASDFVL